MQDYAYNGSYFDAIQHAGHWPQNGNPWRILPLDITLPIPWAICSPEGPHRQRGIFAGDYLDDRFTGQSGQLQVLESGSGMSLMF